MSFAATLRTWRLESDLSQRELARRVGMDYTYLSKIEAGLVSPPAEDKIRSIGRVLGLAATQIEELVHLARETRVPTGVVKAALIRNPEVGALLRRIKDRPLTESEAAIVRGLAESMPTQEHEEDASTS